MKYWLLYFRVSVVFLFLMSDIQGQIVVSDIFNPSVGLQDGVIHVVTSGSAAPFTLSLCQGESIISSSPGTFTSGPYAFTNLAAGSYVVKIKDKTDCIVEIPVILEEVDRCGLSIVVNDFRHSTGRFLESCPGQDDYDDEVIEDGLISVTITAIGSYTVQWMGPDGPLSTVDGQLSDLKGGIYTITVVSDDIPNCIVTEEFIIYYCTTRGGCYHQSMLYGDDGPSIILNHQSSPNHGLCTGSLSVTIADDYGAERFKYYWTDQSGGVYSDRALTELCPGTYCLHVLLGCGDPLEECFTLVDCSLQPIVLSPVDACRDPEYTDFPFVLTGGVDPVVVEFPVVNGQKKFVVTDARGCSEELVFSMNAISDWSASIDIIRPKTLFGGAIISVLLEGASGMSAPYTAFIEGTHYAINNLVEVNTIFLPRDVAGRVFIFIQDKDGCMIEIVVDIPMCQDVDPMVAGVGVVYPDGGGIVSAPNRSSQCVDGIMLGLSIRNGIGPYAVSLVWY